MPVIGCSWAIADVREFSTTFGTVPDNLDTPLPYQRKRENLDVSSSEN